MRLILLFISIVAALFKLGGEPEVVVNEPPYARVVLNDNATLETYEYAQGDTVLVVLTVCAPECSSCARIYNKEGEVVRTITPPFESVFPIAMIEDSIPVWKDNDTWEY